MIQAIIIKGKVFRGRGSSPNVSKGSVLIKVVNICISAGTVMSAVQSSGKSLIKRALEKPENIKKVLDLVNSDSIAKDYAKVKGNPDGGDTMTTGYSISGIVIAVGVGVDELKVGDSAAAAGTGLANHAEYVDVPKILVIKMPETINFEDVFTVTLKYQDGSIASTEYWDMIQTTETTFLI